MDDKGSEKRLDIIGVRDRQAYHLSFHISSLLLTENERERKMKKREKFSKLKELQFSFYNGIPSATIF